MESADLVPLGRNNIQKQKPARDSFQESDVIVREIDRQAVLRFF